MIPNLIEGLCNPLVTWMKILLSILSPSPAIYLGTEEEMACAGGDMVLGGGEEDCTAAEEEEEDGTGGCCRLPNKQAKSNNVANS